MVWHRWDPPPASASGCGSEPLLVLLHGGSGSWTHWAANIERLSRDRPVLAGDLPGLGDSPSPDEPYDAGSLAGIVSAGLDDLLAREQPFHLAGFSFGGIVSGHLAIAQARRCRSVTVIGSPPFGIGGSGPANDLIAVDPGLDFDQALPLHRRNLRTMMIHDPARVDALALRIHHDNLRRARLKSRKIARTDTLAVALRQAPCPVRGIWGEHDVTVHPDMDALRSLILGTGDDASFNVVPGAGHWVMYEAPEAVNRLLSAQLEEHTEGSNR